MRSRAPLVLMEQVVMILVFALAAALCVQVFVYADRTSRYHESRDRAIVEAQNAAESIKQGSAAYFDNGNWKKPVYFDENWQRMQPKTDAKPVTGYALTVVDIKEDTYIWTAEVRVVTVDGDVLIALPVAVQREVGADA